MLLNQDCGLAVYVRELLKLPDAGCIQWKPYVMNAYGKKLYLNVNLCDTVLLTLSTKEINEA